MIVIYHSYSIYVHATHSIVSFFIDFSMYTMQNPYGPFSGMQNRVRTISWILNCRLRWTFTLVNKIGSIHITIRKQVREYTVCLKNVRVQYLYWMYSYSMVHSLAGLLQQLRRARGHDVQHGPAPDADRLPLLRPPRDHYDKSRERRLRRPRLHAALELHRVWHCIT